MPASSAPTAPTSPRSARPRLPLSPPKPTSSPPPANEAALGNKSQTPNVQISQEAPRDNSQNRHANPSPSSLRRSALRVQRSAFSVFRPPGFSSLPSAPNLCVPQSKIENRESKITMAERKGLAGPFGHRFAARSARAI